MWHPNRSQWIVIWIAALVALIFWVGPDDLIRAITPQEPGELNLRAMGSRRTTMERIPVVAVVLGALLVWQLAGPKKNGPSPKGEDQ